MTKGIKMMNSSTNILDEILEKGNRGRDASGICYSNSRRKQAVSHQKWVVAYSKQDQRQWRCYHCGKKGHIAPYCYKIYGRGKIKYSQPRMDGSRRQQPNYRALRVYNKRTQVIMESIKVKVVDEEAEHTETEPEEPVTPTVIDSGRIP
ncbi:hypothetical protein LIER_19855 [Lithospermum erythrorhizon]|uniref:CCHC-type domain-containing protein n=1 Tax=Lithospermum erythrorhizon TaxID=34254 RepID=A0AAV3QN03_LITER